MKVQVVLLAATALLSALRLEAFLPPVDEKDGVSLRIAWFDEGSSQDGSLKLREVNAGEPLEISIAVSNMSERRVRGALDVWLNDDWTIEGDSSENVSIEPGEQRVFRRTAVAGPRVVDGIYPVHAELRSKSLVLHPVAMFRARPPRTSGSRSAIWALDECENPFLAEVELGTNGLFDAKIGIGDSERRLIFSGFECDVDGARVRAVDGFSVLHADGMMRVDHRCGFGRVLRAELWAEGGALKVKWSMPFQERSSSGSPRYTRLAIGECSYPAMRSYAGLGNVVEDPVKFRLWSEGFRLSTRHVGADYANGLSLLQASDVFPDALECDSVRKFHSLVTHHDATLTFMPSRGCAFNAARKFAAASGYRAAPGVERLMGKMCLDQWWGDFRTAGSNILQVAKYGVTDAVYVRHEWQRWGYDYRLPDICPAHDHDGLSALRRDCSEAGIEFCLHDNYIDCYPDSDGFTYDDIVFNDDGTPFRAWYNKGRRAQSYRWLPHAFSTRLEQNAREMRRLYDPDALFIDVFTAIAPFDYRDRFGRFYPKTVTQEEWGKAFDTARACFGKPESAMISEAGTDALIGHVDACQSDHLTAERWFDYAPVFTDSERVPWHDIVTHGKMVLFAGGLGNRYAAIDWNTPGDESLHGYGSDDYLSATVIGGRAPMCDGPFNRRAVMTYWLLHDVCAELARSEFLEFGFDGANIHRQHSLFSKGEVWVNRSSNSVWRVSGGVLPRYGFIARCEGSEAAVVETDGRRWAYSSGPSGVFVDSRGSGVRSAFGVSTDGAVRITTHRNGVLKRYLPFTGPNREMLVTPLPDSGSFGLVVDPVEFGFPRGRVRDVVAVDPQPDATEVRWTQRDGMISLRADGRSFAYRILFK